jgi:hypothetical protein
MKNLIRGVIALGLTVLGAGCVSDYSFSQASPGSGSAGLGSGSGSGGSGGYPGSTATGSGGTGSYPGGNNAPGAPNPDNGGTGTGGTGDYPGAPSPTGNPGTVTTTAIQTNAFAVASRGASCLMCHANIQSDLISDFGLGNDYFLDTGYEDYAMGSFYFNEDLGAWQTASISGNLIVPNVTINQSNMPQIFNVYTPGQSGNSMTLAQMLTSPVQANLAGQTLSSSSESNVSNYSGNPSTSSMSSAIQSGYSVVQKTSVFIGAPTDANILGMTNAPQSAGGYALVSSNSGDTLSGLSKAQGSSGPYVTNGNGGTITCTGDVVVNGTLYLVNPTIVTGSAGCRLYVAGTVFEQGAITFTPSSSGATPNVQIESSRAIMMGFDQTTVDVRMLLGSMQVSGCTVSPAGAAIPNNCTLSRQDALYFSFTRGAPTASAIQTKHQGIYNEALNLPSSGSMAMVDADNASGGNTVPFTHLLLNAPEIHTRYEGTLTGVVIGEIVIGRLEGLVFKNDPLFQSIQDFPMTPVPLLNIVN